MRTPRVQVGTRAARAHVVALLLLLCSAATAAADSVNTRERTATKVAEGVYVIRHPDAPNEFPQGNTTVVVGSRAVLVVDSCYLPSSAREDIAQIRRWTDKPVRYLVNTHWHHDHVLGNGAYHDAFPQLAVVAHAETQKQIGGYISAWASERFPKYVADLRRTLDAGKEDDGRPLTDERRAALTKTLEGSEAVFAEFRNFTNRVPDVTFDREMTFDLGDREVRVMHLGRGNTAGDAVVFLPRERIAVAGDLLDHPVPYLGGGYPSQLARTLGELARLDAQTIVPGHGDVLRGDYARAYLSTVADFVRAVVAQVSREVYRVGNGPRNLEAVRAAVLREIDMGAWRQKIAGDDKDNREFFDTFSMPGLITAAYAEVWGR